MTDKKPRKRTPISCLNCRKRKVKCDKQRPSCGGCVRHGVGHLCEYLDPVWADKDSEGLDAIRQLEFAADVLQVEKLRQEKESVDKIVASQSKQIEDLKRQLNFKQQLSADHSNDSSATKVMALTKLNGLKNPENLQIGNDVYMNVYSKNQITRILKGIYSWVSVIKLDPKLSALWAKISNMQKMYYLYKSSKFKSINAETKCPVVKYDLTLMNEPKVSPKPNSNPSEEESPLSDLTEHERNCLHASKLMQKAWTGVIKRPGGEKVNGVQINFLLDSYFECNHSTKIMVSYFKESIYDSYKTDGNGVFLNLQLYRDSVKPHEVGPNAAYRSFIFLLLLMVVDESLDSFRLNVKQGLEDDLTLRFQELFPSESYSDYQYNESNIENVIACLNEFLVADLTNIEKSLSVYTTVLVILNRATSLGARVGGRLNGRIEVLYCQLFKLLLEEEPLEIWKNPYKVHVENNESKKKVSSVRIQLCYLWNETVRVVNLLTFSAIPINEVSPELDSMITKFYMILEEASIGNYHETYLASLKSNDIDNLTTALKVHSLLGKVNLFLNRGVENLSGPQLTVKDLDELSSHCGSWLQDTSLERLPLGQRLELKVMLHFAHIFLTYIIFLQAEASKIYEYRDYLISGLFARLNVFFKFTEEFKSLNDRSQYLIYGLSETFVSIVQISVAILTRVLNKNHQEDLFKQLSTVYYAMSFSLGGRQTNLRDLVKVEVCDRIDKCLEMLSQRLVNKVHIGKLGQLWNFYLALMNNEDRFEMNPSKFHSNIPEFKNMEEADINKCPVVHNSNGKCPVDHGKCPVDHNSKKRSLDMPELATKRSKPESPKVNDFEEFFKTFGTSEIGYEDPGSGDFNFSFANLDLDFLQNYSLSDFATPSDPSDFI